MVRNIGIDVPYPKEECNDKNCPFHGNLPIRGKIIEGKIVSTKPFKTVIIKREYFHYIPKYERYERRSSKIAAHLPPCLKGEVGKIAVLGECRPISKTKKFVVIQIKD